MIYKKKVRMKMIKADLKNTLIIVPVYNSGWHIEELLKRIFAISDIVISALYKSAISYTKERSWPVWMNPSAGEQPSAAITLWVKP